MDNVQKAFGAIAQWASDYPKAACYVAGVITGVLLMVLA